MYGQSNTQGERSQSSSAQLKCPSTERDTLQKTKEKLHCIRAVSQQVSLKLFGWMDAWIEMAGLRWREGWSKTLALFSLAFLCLLPLFSSYHHFDTLSLHISAFPPSACKGSSQSGRSAQMWHRPHLPLTNREKEICIKTREAIKNLS